MLRQSNKTQSQTSLCATRSKLYRSNSKFWNVLVLTICLAALTAGIKPAIAASQERFTIKSVTGISGAMKITVGQDRSIELLNTSCPTAWRVGDPVSLNFSDSTGLSLHDLRSRRRAMVIGLTNVPNPIDTEYQECAAKQERANEMHAWSDYPRCTDHYLVTWRDQIIDVLNFSRRFVPQQAYKMMQLNHVVQSDSMARLIDFQERYVRRMRRLMHMYNQFGNFVGSTPTSDELAKWISLQFYKQLNPVLWAQLRNVALPGDVRSAASCQ